MTKMTTQQRDDDWMTVPRTCSICHKRYTDLTSVGKWECTEHVSRFMVLVPDGRGGIPHWIWPCCGKTVAGRVFTVEEFYARQYSPDLRGCIRADHKDSLVPYCMRPIVDHTTLRYQEASPSWLVSQNVIIRNKIVPLMSAQRISSTLQGNIVVYRYDKDEVDRVKQYK